MSLVLYAYYYNRIDQGLAHARVLILVSQSYGMSRAVMDEEIELWETKRFFESRTDRGELEERKVREKYPLTE